MKQFIITVLMFVCITINAQTSDSIVCLPASSIIKIAQVSKQYETENIDLKNLNSLLLSSIQTYDSLHVQDSTVLDYLYEQNEILNHIQLSQKDEIQLCDQLLTRTKKRNKIWIIVSSILVGIVILK